LVLVRHGFEVIEAENGQEAIDLAGRRYPSLILMDASLPQVDGIAATRRIRERESLRDVPIIFLSGRAEPTAVADARGAGCSDYLVKPIDMDLLDELLQRSLGRSDCRRLPLPAK
jgi:CheY-like chemotaxis protein